MNVNVFGMGHGQHQLDQLVGRAHFLHVTSPVDIVF